MLPEPHRNEPSTDATPIEDHPALRAITNGAEPPTPAHPDAGDRREPPEPRPTRRRWGVVLVTACLVLLVATGRSPITFSWYEGPAPTSASDADLLEEIDRTRTDVKLDADEIKLPARWRHDPELSGPGVPVFRARADRLILEIGLVDAPVPDAVPVQDVVKGIDLGQRGDYPGYERIAVTETDFVEGALTFDHEFTWVNDGKRLHSLQFIVADREAQQIWYVTATSPARLDDGARQQLRDDLLDLVAS